MRQVRSTAILEETEMNNKQNQNEQNKQNQNEQNKQNKNEQNKNCR